MATASITYRGTREDVTAIVQRLPGILAGHEPDPWGIVQGLQLRMGMVLLSKISQAFVVKARGGVGEDGIQWPPLKPETIARRRTTRAGRKAAGLTAANRLRGLLTGAQDDRWKKLFGKWLAICLFRGMAGDAAKERAARIAWSVLKGEGVKTKLGVFGGRTVEILRDTNELFGSFAAGQEGQPSGADGQILRTPTGAVIVGTNKKPWHHRGNARLPARPYWPLDGNLPPAWWDAIQGSLQRGLLVALQDILSREAA